MTDYTKLEGKRMTKLVERIAMWIAWKLPAPVAYWAHVRVTAHATTGKYGDTIVPELSAMDAGARFANDQGWHGFKVEGYGG